MSISAIIISYRNPDYLDLALKSATENSVLPETEIIVVLDGYAEESEHVIKKYPGIHVLPFEENQGQTKAHNTGVAMASNEAVLIVNDDNVFPYKWDAQLDAIYDPKKVIAPNQCEPNPSIFPSFIIRDFGTTPDTFAYDEYVSWTEKICQTTQIKLAAQSIRNFHDVTPTVDYESFSSDGQTWPVFMSKKWYMILGGIDPYFPSPAAADWDFFMRCELAGLQCMRYKGTPFYHFAGAATKRSLAQAQKHAHGEMQSFEYFAFKWGFLPSLGKNNSKLTGNVVRGIQV